jgi:5'-methylthioadenosine phosphorylase
MLLGEPPEKVSIGLIGGTGVYDPEIFTDIKEYKIYTPFGAPSDKYMVGALKGRRIAFLPRHGRLHSYPPHNVNYRANIWGFKALGVKRLISVSATGSLQPDYDPGELVIPDQCFDWTRQRKKTFFDTGVTAHASLADPFCPELRQFIIDKAKKIKLPLFEKGTYITIEGPQFSTRAESIFYKNQGFHIIGMTMNPEINLAREAELCYATIAMITDYDVWAEKPVSHEEVIQTMQKNIGKVRNLLAEVIPNMIEEQSKCECGTALQGAI